MNQESHPANAAIVIGRLGTVTEHRRAGQRTERVQVVAARRYTPAGGAQDQFAVQLATPTGAPFALHLRAGATTPGVELLASRAPGDPIAVEGMVQLVAAADDSAPRDMQFQVMAIRDPRPDEPAATTAAWLRGTIVEPPRFARHHGLRSLQVATTILEMYLDRELPGRPGYPGLRRQHRDRIEVPLAISADHEQAGFLFRPGNQLLIDGEIARVVLEQRGPQVDAAVAALEQEWMQRERELEGRPEGERGAARWQHRQQIERLSREARTVVMASFIQPGPGAAPISAAEARRLRREFVEHLRSRRGTAVARSLSQAAAASLGVNG